MFIFNLPEAYDACPIWVSARIPRTDDLDPGIIEVQTPLVRGHLLIAYNSWFPVL